MPVDRKWIDLAVVATRALERMYAASVPAGVDTNLSIGWTEENPFVVAEYGNTGIAVILLRTKSREHAHEAALALRAELAEPDEEHRCGTCDFGRDYTCNHLRVSTKVTMRNGSDDGGYLTEDDGPPWPNCRFWRKR